MSESGIRSTVEMHSPEELVWLLYDMSYAAGLAEGAGNMESRARRFEERAIDARAGRQPFYLRRFLLEKLSVHENVRNRFVFRENIAARDNQIGDFSLLD